MSRGDIPLTASEACSYLPKLVSKRRTTMNWAGSYEADIQAAESQAGEQARVPGSDEDGGWAQDAQSSQKSRACTPRGAGRRQVDTEGVERVEGLPREARIRLGSEIRGLLERGKRKRTKNVDVFLAASPASRSRLGLIIPKHGHKIVARNLLKRRLREICRRRVLPDLDVAGVSFDVLIRAKRSAYDMDFVGLESEVIKAVEDLCSASS